MRRRATPSERLALSLGFTIERGKKHDKVLAANGRMIAVIPHGRSRDKGNQWNNYRAALLRAARNEQ